MEIAAASTLAAVRLRTAIRPAAVRPGPIRREPSLVIDHDLPDPAVKEPRVLKASPPPHLVESFVRRREQEKQHQQELVNARASDLSSEADDVASSCGRRSPYVAGLAAMPQRQSLADPSAAESSQKPLHPSHRGLGKLSRRQEARENAANQLPRRLTHEHIWQTPLRAPAPPSRTTRRHLRGGEQRAFPLIPTTWIYPWLTPCWSLAAST